MSFDEIVSDVAGRLALTTTDAITRIGLRVNRRYRRITTSIGMVTTRRTTGSFTVVAATRTQTIPGEKVLSISVTGATENLDAVSYDEMLEKVPSTGNPTCWAVKRTNAADVTVVFNSTMDSGLDLVVQVEDVGSTLSGSQVPAFPESWHDILVFGALADELRKKEKIQLARDAEMEYERMLGELRLHIAANGWQDQQQGSRASATTAAGASGSASNGTVTHVTGALTPHAIILGNGGGDVKPLSSLGTATTVVHGAAAGDPTYGPVVEADQTLSDVTTNDVSTTKHGYAPKAPNDATKYLDGTGAYSKPSDPLKANLASPALTGVPTAPTAAALNNSTQLATTAYADAAVVAEATATRTLTNKRITSRVTTIVSSATPTVNTDNCDAVTITAQAVAITSMTTNLSGTPTNFQKLLYRIKDDGTGRAITWGASFVAKGATLPTTTVAGKLLTAGFIYDTVAATWGCVASVQET